MNQISPSCHVQILETPQRFHVALGGALTLGQGIASPFADILAAVSGQPVLNLGCAHAGPDALLGSEVLALAAKADTAILELPPLRNLSNAFYCVHPRRNDRFVAPTPLLTALFPEMDFTGIHFTHHLVQTLAATCEDRFGEVASALRRRWRERMSALVDRLPRTILLDLDDSADMLGVGDPRALGCPVVRLPAPTCESAHAEIARALLPFLADPSAHTFPVSSGTSVNRSPTRP